MSRSGRPIQISVIIRVKCDLCPEYVWFVPGWIYFAFCLHFDTFYKKHSHCIKVHSIHSVSCTFDFIQAHSNTFNDVCIAFLLHCYMHWRALAHISIHSIPYAFACIHVLLHFNTFQVHSSNVTSEYMYIFSAFGSHVAFCCSVTHTITVHSAAFKSSNAFRCIPLHS